MTSIYGFITKITERQPIANKILKRQNAQSTFNRLHIKDKNYFLYSFDVDVNPRPFFD